jgi:hypothetical protein
VSGFHRLFPAELVLQMFEDQENSFFSSLCQADAMYLKDVERHESWVPDSILCSVIAKDFSQPVRGSV